MLPAHDCVCSWFMPSLPSPVIWAFAYRSESESNTRCKSDDSQACEYEKNVIAIE